MLQARVKQSEQVQDESSGIALMTGETVRATLGTSLADDSNADKDSVLLTDRRVIHISGRRTNRRTAHAAIEDISAVAINRQAVKGYGAFVWAALAFLVSVLLWRVIDSEMLALGAAAVVALMGVYLIIDRLWERGEHGLVIRTGSAEIRCALTDKNAQSEAEAFILRLFELKYERSNPQHTRAKTFAPR
ncbi:MAG: hypothetical protein F4X57_00135 [Chloroflexi bacterium]|nr:hypothetical protein [Chloroflexota bacterium]